MTTRDPRSRDPLRPDSAGARREPTQSLSVDPDEELSGPGGASYDPEHPSLALGTHEARRRNDHTKVDSPQARSKTPQPPKHTSSRPPIPRDADDPDERVGAQLGSYRVVELLGKGGMGYVYRAEHVKLGREVALKLLRSDYSKRRDAVARFFQEARTVNRVRHRNIVDVTDFVELDDGTTFIIMEFLRGGSLGRWARTGIDLPRALAVLVQICDGLAAAHAVSVVHRDLKPDNVIVVPTSDGAELVKLLDFGVAKLLNRDDEDIGFQTAAGSVIGTPAYMSPEQAGGMPIDHRSDIYSLGAIMYELFCGQPMFRGRSFGEYVRKHLTEMPVLPHLTQGGAHIDHRLEALIMRCLDKEPNNRFGHISELRDALLHLLGGMETHPPGFGTMTGSGLRGAPQVPTMPTLPSGLVIPIAPTPQPSHQSSQALASGQQMMHPSSGPHAFLQYSQIGPPQQLAPTPWWVWFVGGAVAVALGIGAAVWYAGRDQPPQVATATPSPAEPPQVAPPIAPPIAQPIETPAPPRPKAPQLIEVRFDSLPSGGVFADGHSAELCRTPCAFNIDLRDGGPADKRIYIVKSDGYRDAVVGVDLTSSQRDFRVTLEQIAVPVQTSPVELSTKKVGKKKPGKDLKDAKVPTTTTTPTTTTVPTTTKPDPDHLINPDADDPNAAKQPDTIKQPNGNKIDPADTLDPFHRKRP